MKELKNRIKFIRTSKNLSQNEFWRIINLSRSQIAGYETGTKNITARAINDICREFNINKGWLLNGTGDMYDSKNNITNLELKESICNIIMKINNIDSLNNIKNLSNLLLNLDK